MFCKKCGASNLATASVCTNCGAPLSGAPAPSGPFSAPGAGGYPPLMPYLYGQPGQLPPYAYAPPRKKSLLEGEAGSGPWWRSALRLASFALFAGFPVIGVLLAVSLNRGRPGFLAVAIILGVLCGLLVAAVHVAAIHVFVIDAENRSAVSENIAVLVSLKREEAAKEEAVREEAAKEPPAQA